MPASTRPGRVARLLLVLAALTGAGPAAAVNDDSAAWFGVTRNGDFGDEDWSSWLYTAHVEYRLFDALEGTRQAVARGGVGHRLQGGWRAFVQADYRQSHSPALGTIREQRLREMVQWTGPGWGPTALRLRFLLEQRWIDERDGTAWRFRPRVGVDFPLGEGKSANGIVFAETFHDLRSTSWVDSGWNEKRLFLGVRLFVRPGMNVDTGYLAQWVNPFDTGDQLNHTLVAMFRYR